MFDAALSSRILCVGWVERLIVPLAVPSGQGRAHSSLSARPIGCGRGEKQMMPKLNWWNIAALVFCCAFWIGAAWIASKIGGR